MIRRLLVSALSLILSVSAMGGTTRYKIKSGDNVSAIAEKFSTTWNAIRKANHLSSDKLKLGQVLVIPSNGQTSSAVAAKQTSPSAKHAKHTPASSKHAASSTWIYTVKDGDSDWLIARRFDIHISDLKALNPGLIKLKPGMKVRVPSNTSPLVARASSASKPIAHAKKLSGRYAMVSGNNVRVRKKPSAAGSVKQTVSEGTPVVMLDRQSEWTRVRFPYGTEGWVRSDLLSPISKAAKKQLTVASRRKRSYELQAVASTHSRRKKRSKSKYHYVRNHRTGRVTREVDPSWVATNDGKVDTILQSATSMRGVRYRYGAMSRSGTDCSGFTSQVYSKNGIKLPRTSGAQSSVGAKVDRSGLKAGDLVFFQTVRGKRVSHVGIYMGNGKFIHASSGGHKVQVNSLNDGYYNRRFVTARRVVKGSGAKSSKPVEKKVETKAAETPAAPVTTAKDTVSN